MKRLILVVLVLAAASIALPASAAIRAYVGVNLSLRAGPDQGYPRITVVPSGLDVVVYGSFDDWSWCDFGFSGHRGWVAGDYLRYDYRGRDRMVAAICGRHRRARGDIRVQQLLGQPLPQPSVVSRTGALGALPAATQGAHPATADAARPRRAFTRETRHQQPSSLPARQPSERRDGRGRGR